MFVSFSKIWFCVQESAMELSNFYPNQRMGRRNPKSVPLSVIQSSLQILCSGLWDRHSGNSNIVSTLESPPKNWQRLLLLKLQCFDKNQCWSVSYAIGTLKDVEYRISLFTQKILHNNKLSRLSLHRWYPLYDRKDT